MRYEFDTRSQEETEALGAAYGKQLVPGDVSAMYGDLGAGKTAFVRGALRSMGYEGTVSSPTFAIVNEYRGGRLDCALFDVYRIGSEEELYGTGFYDYLDGRNAVFIEWSENIPFAVTDDMIRITIEHTGAGERRIIIESPRELVFC